MKQNETPFKFLDSYQKEDADIFFGREKETKALYNALSGVKHLLVYGPSGTGKTSLIECGLRNQFSDADWFAIRILRGADLTASVFESINRALRQPIELDANSGLPVEADFGFGEAVEQLFSERFQPVYLLFDQFEELLIKGSEEEKKDFFTRLQSLIRYKVPCRLMLIMREEFIGHLSEFEPLCPSIFQHRFRLETMGRSTVQQVIQLTLESPHYSTFFHVSESEQLAEKILSKLPDDKKDIELTHVQVFLSELWNRARATQQNTAIPVLYQSLVREEDNLTGVLDSFLKSQLKELAPSYGEKSPLEVLAAMISERHTKLRLSEAEILHELEVKGFELESPLSALLKDLESRKIIRSLKSGDTMRFEISHDALALVVGQNLTEEMKMREKARDIYAVYEDEKRSGFFSQDDLDYLRPYHQYLPYSDSLASKIKESEAEVLRIAETEKEKEREKLRLTEEKLAAEAEGRRRQTLFSYIVGAVALVAIVAGVYGYVQRNEADKQKTEALRLRDIADEKTKIAVQKTNEAIEEKNKSQELLNEIKKQKGITDESLKQTAEALQEVKNKEAARLNAEQLRKNEAAKNINNKIQDIRDVLQIGDKSKAKELLREALEIEPNHPELLKLKKELNIN